MVIALRIAAGLLAVVWAVFFFALIDFSILFLPNGMFVDVAPLEVSWGSLFTFFMVVPLVVVAIRPRRYGDAVLLAAVAVLALVVGAALARDARPLWLAAAAAATGGVVFALGASAKGKLPLPALHVRVTWPMALLAVAGVPLWWPYIVHAASAPGVLPSDESVDIDHWPVQAAAGVAVLLAAFSAAMLPATRVLSAVAAAVPAAAIGVSMAAGASIRLLVATESVQWSVLVVLWGVAVALALSVPTRSSRTSSATRSSRTSAAPAD